MRHRDVRGSFAQLVDHRGLRRRDGGGHALRVRAVQFLANRSELPLLELADLDPRATDRPPG